MKLKSNLFFYTIIALPVAIALSGHALAQAINKDTDGTELTATGSWVGDAVPGAGNVATWSTGSLGGALTIGSNVAWQGVDIQSATAAISTTGAGRMTLGGSGINIASTGLNLTLGNTAFTADSAQDWNIGSGRTLTVSPANTSGNFGGTGKITVKGTGTVVLSASVNAFRNFAGGWQIDGGEVKNSITNGLNTGASAWGTQALVLNGGTASFDGTAFSGWSNAITVSANSTIKNYSGGSFQRRQILTGAITASTGVELTFENGGNMGNAGTTGFMLSNDNSGFHGTLNVGNGGSTTVGLIMGGINSQTGTVGTTGNLASDAIVNLANGTGKSVLGLNHDSGAWTFASKIQGAGDVFAGALGAGTQTVTISGANTYSGSTTVVKGTVKLGSATALGTTDAGTTVTSGAVLDLNGETVGAETLTLNGTGISSGGALINSSGSAASLSGGISLASASSVGGSGDSTLSGVISGGSGSALTKVGTGVLTLSGVNTYTGATTVNGGTLALGAGGSIDGSSTITVAAVGTLDVSAAMFTLGTSQTLAGAGTVAGTVNHGAFGGTITPSGGNLSIGSLAYSGDGIIKVTPGVAILNVTNTDGLSTSTDPVTIDVQGGALTPGQYPVIDYAGSIQGNGIGSFVVGTTPGGAYTYTLVDNATNGSVDLVVASLADIWSGAFSNEWSTAAIGGSKNWTLNAVAADYADGHDVQFTDAATGTTTVDISVADVTPASVAFNHSTLNYTLQGSKAIAGVTDFTKAGTGTLTITNVNKFTGAVTIGGGTVSVASVANGGADSPLGAGTDISLGNGTLSYTGTTASTDRSLTLTAAGTLDVADGGAALTLSGAVSGSGSLAKTGAGVLEVTGSSGSFSGSTQVDGGTFRISDGAVWGGGAMTNHSAIEVNRTTDLTLSNAISGSGTLVKNGSGILTLSGVSSYGGGTTINAGTVKASAASNLGTGAVAIGASGTLNTTAGMTLSASLSGSGTLKASSGVVILNGTNNTLSGLIDVQAGDVVLDNTGSENGAPSVNMSGGRFILSSPFAGNTATIGNLTGTAGTINPQYNATTGIRTLQVNQTVDGTFGGNIQDGGGSRFVGLTKTGAATLTLTGTSNTYTGATTVNGGTLALGASNVLADTTPVSIGAATLSVAASATDAAGVLDPTAAATIQLGAGSVLAFADSSAVDWTDGTLAVTGTFVPGSSLRFGTSSSGLTPAQIALITVAGHPNLALDANGYLVDASGYSAWAAANGTAQTIDQDHDGDGVPNGVEFFFGGPNSTTGFTPQPGITGTSVTYTKHSGYSGAYGTDFVIETSETLSGAWTQETVGGNVVQSGDSFTYTFPTGGPAKKFVRLKVTGPQ